MNTLISFSSSLKENFLSGEEMARNRKAIVISNYSAETASNLIAGNFLTGFLLLMKADDAFMGLITLLGMSGNIFQVLSPLILERFSSRKKLLIFQRGIIYFFNVILIGIISILPFPNKGKLTSILALLVMISIFNALFSPGFPVWHLRSIPDNIRAQYFSFYRISSGIIIYVFTIGASALLDFFKSQGNELKGHLVLRAGVLILCVIDLFFLTRVKEYPIERSIEAIRIVDVFLKPFKQSTYMKSVVIACLWNFAAYIPGPYYSIYLLKEMGLHYSYINIVASANIPILILCTPIWAKVINRISWFKTLSICMGAYILNYVGLAFVTKDTMVIYPVTMIYGLIFFSGINLVFSNIAFINIPSDNQTNFIGFFQTMNFIAAMLGTAFGRTFIKLTEKVNIGVWGMQMGNKQCLMLVTAAVMIISTVIIILLQKEKSKS